VDGADPRDDDAAYVAPPLPTGTYSDLCDLLILLGPCFVKLGQTLSTRTDLIGEPAALALGRLHSSVPPYPDREALATIRRELQIEPAECLEGLERGPVAAASLGQVRG
jgi:ubiquinone biosynthesis protein